MQSTQKEWPQCVRHGKVGVSRQIAHSSSDSVDSCSEACSAKDKVHPCRVSASHATPSLDSSEKRTLYNAASTCNSSSSRRFESRRRLHNQKAPTEATPAAAASSCRCCMAAIMLAEALSKSERMSKFYVVLGSECAGCRQGW
eukprot:6211332-Pleurochrysis_carterae.AAC.2